MAAIAPVGGTGLLVVVATPNDALDEITRRMTDRAKAFLWIPALLGLVLLGAAVAGPDLFFRIGAARRSRQMGGRA
jgi:hypothetical protein